MASIIINAKLTGFAYEIPALMERTASLKAIYQQHQNRIYNLAFYLTDNELAAEELTSRVFLNTFAVNSTPSAEVLDTALVNEIRSTAPIGDLTLDEPVANQTANARKNVKRAVLERAVVQIPHTERLIFLMHDVEGYDHSRIARTLGINTDESKRGLHQARLALRRAVSEIKF
ncbi:MAG TPA: sigma-70 family RNA polymerase sigma factor [Terriglobales bacterium]|nr:sigma-70 family RNA polymerase sigma factor [Terriglobales bacterium]